MYLFYDQQVPKNKEVIDTRDIPCRITYYLIRRCVVSHTTKYLKIRETFRRTKRTKIMAYFVVYIQYSYIYIPNKTLLMQIHTKTPIKRQSRIQYKTK